MTWFVPAFDLLCSLTLAAFVLLAAATIVVTLTREPARRIRAIQLALVGLLALPALVLVPGYPRVAWWPAVGEKQLVAVSSPMEDPSAAPEEASIPLPDVAQPLAAAPSAAPASSVEPFPTDATPGPLPTDSAAAEESTWPITPDVIPRLTGSVASSSAVEPVPHPLPLSPQSSTPDTSIATLPIATPALSAASDPTPPRAALPDFRLLILCVYLFGVALLSLWWILGRLALWRLLHTASPAEPHLRALLDEVIAAQPASATNIKRVRLLVSPRAAQPCAVGCRRPTIVLPRRVVKELTPPQLKLALSHEWSHVARGDLRTWMLAGLVRLVYFYQPLVWLLRRELRISQDYLADAAAASSGTPEDYAELLTTLSQMLRPTPLAPGLGIASRKSELYRRVIMLVDQSRPLERTIPRRWNFAAIALSLALLAGAATLRAEPETPEAEDREATAAPKVPTPQAEEPTAEAAQNETPLELRPEQIRKNALDHARQELRVYADPEVRRLQQRLDDLRKIERASGLELNTVLRAFLADAERKLAERTQTLTQPASDPPRTTEKAPLDRGTLAVQLIEARQKLESVFKHRKAIEKRLEHEDRADVKKLLLWELQAIDDHCVEEAKKLRELETQLNEALPATTEPTEEPKPQVTGSPEGRSETGTSLEDLLEEYQLKQLIQQHNDLRTLRKALLTQSARFGKAEQEAVAARIRELDKKSHELGLQINEVLTQRRRESVSELLQGDLNNAVQALDQQLKTGRTRHELEQQIASLRERLAQLEKLREQLTKAAEQQILVKERAKIDQQIEQVALQQAVLSQVLQERMVALAEAQRQSKGEASPVSPYTEPRPAALPEIPIEDLAHVIADGDPRINMLKDRLAAAQDQLDHLRNRLASPTEAKQLQQSVLQLEEQIAERRQQLLPGLTELLAGIQEQPRPTRPAQPFSGRIRPGDILGIEIVGGVPGYLPPTRTVEPDGNVALGAIYGPASRVSVAGKTLIEAGQTIKEQLRAALKDPQVLVTYKGHDDGIVATASAGKHANSNAGIIDSVQPEPTILAPLDTIEIILPPTKIHGHLTEIDGHLIETFGGIPPQVSGTYLIEPDGRIALPESAGRLKLAGLTEEQASATLRGRLATSLFPSTALPNVRVLRRGHAVFDEDKQPTADYKIRPGDRLVIRSNTLNPESKLQVDAEGMVGWGPQVHVAGMTLEEAQAAFRKEVRTRLGTSGERSWPWVISLGGWREEADPRVIDQINGIDAKLETAPPPGKPASSAQAVPAPIQPTILAPLDTIEIILPLARTRSYLSDLQGTPSEVLAGNNPEVSGTYVIEPDGRVALPQAAGRIKLAGLSEAEAGKQLREHLSVHLFPRIALPSVGVLRRGRALFPEGQQPAADYRIKAGDTVLLGTAIPQLWPTVVDAEGNLKANGSPAATAVHVAGLTLQAAQAALRQKISIFGGPGGGFVGDGTKQTAPWLVTLGGWREEADPRVIDIIEGNGSDLQRMEQELRELKLHSRAK